MCSLSVADSRPTSRPYGWTTRYSSRRSGFPTNDTSKRTAWGGPIQHGQSGLPHCMPGPAHSSCGHDRVGCASQIQPWPQWHSPTAHQSRRPRESGPGCGFRRSATRLVRSCGAIPAPADSPADSLQTFHLRSIAGAIRTVEGLTNQQGRPISVTHALGSSSCHSIHASAKCTIGGVGTLITLRSSLSRRQCGASDSAGSTKKRAEVRGRLAPVVMAGNARWFCRSVEPAIKTIERVFL